MNYLEPEHFQNFNIRRMTSGDIPSVLEIDLLSFPNPWPKNSYEYEINHNPNSRPWIGSIFDGEIETICSFAVFWNIVDETHIGTIAVHPDYRNRGLGTGILRELLLISKKEGMVRVLLEVRESNLHAIKMYKKFGFEVDGIRKKYYRDNGENALLLSSSLNTNL